MISKYTVAEKEQKRTEKGIVTIRAGIVNSERQWVTTVYIYLTKLWYRLHRIIDWHNVLKRVWTATIAIAVICTVQCSTLQI